MSTMVYKFDNCFIPARSQFIILIWELIKESRSLEDEPRLPFKEVRVRGMPFTESRQPKRSGLTELGSPASLTSRGAPAFSTSVAFVTDPDEQQ